MRLIRKIFQVRKHIRLYSSKPLVGPKFNSLDEIKSYIFKDTLSAKDYLTQSEAQEDEKLAIPSKETVLKLLKLSGLPSKGADIAGIQQTLSKQISFIHILSNTQLDKDLNDRHARLIPRDSNPLSYEALMLEVENNIKNPEAAEENGSWDSTSGATIQYDRYFVIKEEFLENRD